MKSLHRKTLYDIVANIFSIKLVVLDLCATVLVAGFQGAPSMSAVCLPYGRHAKSLLKKGPIHQDALESLLESSL